MMALGVLDSNDMDNMKKMMKALLNHVVLRDTESGTSIEKLSHKSKQTCNLSINMYMAN